MTRPCPASGPCSTEPGEPPPAGAPPLHPYSLLTPQAALDALEACGLRCDGRLLQLNSYENRVFQVRLDDGGLVVAKFYRPGRWSDAQIAEEHAFAAELLAAELPVVAPLPLDPRGPGAEPAADGGATLAVAQIDGQAFRLAAYPCHGGHGPELDDPATLHWLGRFLGRLHAVGARQAFAHRRRLTPTVYGHASLAALLQGGLIGPAEGPALQQAAQAALAQVDAAFEAATGVATLRLHGDCHPGNILWRDADRGGAGPQIVDFDDACQGPAVQDLWMLLSGERAAMQAQLAALLDGYEAFREFDRRELALVEPLRTLRLLHHNAWIAERWRDPAFPVAFPWFGTPSHWAQLTVQLREQCVAMEAPPLVA